MLDKQRSYEYHEKLPFALQQDALLESMKSNDADYALVEERYFKSYGIDLSAATNIIKDKKGGIVIIRFINYELLRIDNNTFIIKTSTT